MSTAAQPLPAQTAPPPQQPEWNPVQELRKKYPGVANEPDDKIIQHLSNPENFRSAFPEYAHADDATITRNMGRYGGRAKQPAAQIGSFQQKPGGEVLRPNAAELGDMEQRQAEAHFTGADRPAPIELLRKWAVRGKNDSEMSNLLEAARTGKQPAVSPVAGYGMVADAAQMGESMTTPKGILATGAAAAFPEIAGPVMFAHGGLTAAKNADKAAEGNPEAMQAALMGGAEMVGGKAAMKGVVESPQPTPTGMALSKAWKVAKGEPVFVPAAPKAMTQAIQPGVNIPRAQESIPIAGGRIQQLLKDKQLVKADGTPITEIKSTGDQLEAIAAAKRHVWNAVEQRTGPVAQLSPDTSAIADAMEKSITKRTAAQYPKEAEAIRARAQTYRGNMKLGDVEEAIQDANNDLRGFYKRAGATDSPVGPDMAATQAEVQAARKLLDEKVEELGGAGVKDLKREYGALRDVERATAKQHAISTRTKEGGLWEGLAYLHSAGDLLSGNLLGAARGALSLQVGKSLRTIRDPNYLIGQSFHGAKAFEPSEAIEPSAGPPAPKGLLPKPATEVGGPTDLGSMAREDKQGSRWVTPRALLEAPKPSAVKVSTDSMGIRWAESPEGYRVSIPKRVPDSDIENYAIGKLAEQKKGQTELRDRVAQEKQSTPPGVQPEFATEHIGSVEDPKQLGARGRGGVVTTPKGELPELAEGPIPEKASFLMKQTLGAMQYGDRPGRYFIENEMGDYNPQRMQRGNGVTAGGHWIGIKSSRNVLDWIKDTDFVPGDLERAIAAYERDGTITKAMRSAMEHIRRTEGPKMREPGEDEGAFDAMKLMKLLKGSKQEEPPF